MLNPLEMAGRTILVTGASSGIGRETAILLSRLDARVILVARNREKLEQTLAQLEGTGHATEPFDLSQYEGIPPWMRGMAGKHGRLDGLVHSAGIQITAPLRILDAHQVEQMWKVNVSAALWLAKGFRQRNVHNGGGGIVFLSSAIALVGGIGLAAYSASKGAILALTRSLAVELLREKIRVNCIAPGLIKTEMFDEFSSQLTPENLDALRKAYLLDFGDVGDVGVAAAYLLSDAARWTTGSALVVDGGLTSQ